MRTPMILAWALLALPAPAQAQHPWEDAATVEQAVARAIADAMPDERYPWRLEWDYFGVRGGRDIFWRLGPPVMTPDRDLPEGVHRRTGWLTVNGRTGSVAVCGDTERIGGMAIRISSRALGDGDVIEALASRGVRAVLLETREAPSGDEQRPFLGYYREVLLERHAFQKWRLERDGHELVELGAGYACSPPGMRNGVHCRITWRVTFRPDAPLPGAECTPTDRDWG